ncbi:hypothetical protein T492DRAFT_914744, partial [Pavlovales sp. CCMP2436]
MQAGPPAQECKPAATFTLEAGPVGGGAPGHRAPAMASSRQTAPAPPAGSLASTTEQQGGVEPSGAPRGLPPRTHTRLTFHSSMMGAQSMLGQVNPQFNEIGKAFADHYYKMFDSSRAQLQSLYQGESMLSFEGEQHQGMTAIMQKLTTLNFQTVLHIPKTVDCHPGINGAIVVFVTGNLA